MGALTAISGAASAIGGFQSGQAKTAAINQARLNQHRDALKLAQWKYQQQLGIYEKDVEGYKQNIADIAREVDKNVTRFDKRAAERYGKAAFADVQRERGLIQAEGDIAARLPPGASRDRALAMARSQKGQDEAMALDNLLRARFGDVDQFKDMRDKANQYRRKLYQQLSPPPSFPPLPTAPVMQSGPSALSLIGGLGSSILGGIGAGMSLQADQKSIEASNKILG